MAENSPLQITIALNDPDLDSEDLEQQAQNLLTQLRDLDEIETVDRVLDPNPPHGNKAIGGFLVGLLTVKISKENLQKLWGFLGDRLGNKPIKLKVKAADGRELELEASSPQEFDYAYQKAQEFFKG